VAEFKNHWTAVASPPLDDSQLEALDKSLDLNGCVHLLQGPLGTGKTQTTVAMTDGLVRLGEKVMVDVKMLRHFNQVLNSAQSGRPSK